MQLKELTEYIDKFFSLSTFPAADPSQNGLQVEASQEITTIASAVDACMETFKAVERIPAQLLLVHHGLFWGKSLLLTGVHGKRANFLFANNISLYALHIPLDVHEQLGNNVQLANLLNLPIVRDFGRYQGISIGVETRTNRAITLDAFTKKVEKALDSKVVLLPFGPKKIKRIAIVTGGGSYEIPRARNMDLLLTGEGGHVSYHQAKEYQLNVMYAGHYATETLGVRALGEHLQQQFGIEHEFVDVPTGF